MSHIPADDSLLASLSPQLMALLIAANKRLTHKLTGADILGAIGLAASKAPGTCVFLQPRQLPDSCGTGTVPVAFVVRLLDQVRIRIRRAAQGYGRQDKTPSVWPELRQFPRGDTATKITRWMMTDDCVAFSLPQAQSVPQRTLVCRHTLWSVIV